MPEGFTITVTGLKETDENLARLGEVAGAKVMRSTLYMALKPILAQTIENAAVIQKGSGALVRATRRVALKSTDSGHRFTVAIAPKRTDRSALALANLYYHPKRPRRFVLWGHFVEWGARSKPGTLVFTRAVNSRAAEAIGIFRTRIMKAVTRALKKQSLNDNAE